LIPLSWDGTTTSSATAAAGNYKFSVVATKSGSAVTATGLSVGTLQAVSSSAAGIQASVTGIGAMDSSGNPTSTSVPLSSVQQFL
jgi:flagellar hook assembly protein FlgD